MPLAEALPTSMLRKQMQAVLSLDAVLMLLDLVQLTVQHLMHAKVLGNLVGKHDHFVCLDS